LSVGSAPLFVSLVVMQPTLTRITDGVEEADRQSGQV
jgi:hypothetical protein